MHAHEMWIPIVMFIGLTVVLSLFVWFRFRSKQEMQATIRTAIDKGQELSPELVDKLAGPKPAPNRDLRRGILSVALAISFVLFGRMIGDEDAVGPMTGIAMFPLMIGLGFLLMHFMARRES